MISGKYAEVQYFHQLRVGVELLVTAPVVQCALRSMARTHVTAGTPRRVRLPVPFGGNPHSHVGPGGESVVVVSVSELLLDDAFGQNVHRGFGGGAPFALPDAR